MASLIPDEKIKFWMDNNLSVLLIGKHGVGKTEKTMKLAKKAKLKTLYFSCATLDPWVDFIGVPTKVTKDGKTYLELVRPKAFAFDDVEFIFLDELNRAPPKVQNAVLELIQFGSINGKKFKNLRMIWAAINPPATKGSDTSYHVEELDPAMLTRFKVRFNVPFALDEDFFTAKHGEAVYQALSVWWNDLPMNVRDDFPPRSVHYALEMIALGGDVGDALPASIPKTHFLAALNTAHKVASIKATGVSAKEVFGPLTAVNVKAAIRKNRKDLAPLLLGLSNEEAIKVFSLGANTNGNPNTFTKDILEAMHKGQLNAILSSRIDGFSADAKKKIKEMALNVMLNSDAKSVAASSGSEEDYEEPDEEYGNATM